jgi:hypothetical protein
MSAIPFNLYPFKRNEPPETTLIALSGYTSRSQDSISIIYRFRSGENRIDQLINIQPTEPHPRRLDGLWQRTCCECFLTSKETQGYWEFNLSPSGDWNAYQLEGYRKGLRPDLHIKQLAYGRKTDHDQLEVMMMLQIPKQLRRKAGLKLGIAAVIEHPSKSLSYWALCHTGRDADFHNRDSFLIEMD